MEKLSSAGSAPLRLPPGFRFHPTDEELVVQYLKRKAHSCALPAAVIPDVDLANNNPWDLPGRASEDRYFFHLKRCSGGGRASRATGDGYWRATGKDKAVVCGGSRRGDGGEVVGMKKALVFYHGRRRTDWVMHEYRLAGAGEAQKAEEWVLCRISMKKTAALAAKRGAAAAAAPTSSESSCVTEASDGSASGEEASSGAA